ncbi:rhodanese-like domain-containing protein [Vaginisenegalia massiliensis]|uniref:rhodanese-like domain-containing protein n=1 Tax=Vaginisenegalia massiliensis TaxID=2058294 RepID=UPI000F53E7E5|nr:rhodanese-like domain-containing protein [Vaginisenegalia massiliensis]
MQLLNFITITLATIILIYGAYFAYHWLIRRHSAELVSEDQLHEHMRKAQVIDVREATEFDAKHILGARNIPSSQFKMRYKEIRKDQPVYLYDDYMFQASRAARLLKKNGYQTIYILKDGFSGWTGKIKSN